MTWVNLGRPAVVPSEPKSPYTNYISTPPGCSCLVKIPKRKVVLNSVADGHFQLSGRVQLSPCWFSQPTAEDWENYPVSPNGLQSLAIHHHISLPGEKNLSPCICQQVLGRKWEQIGNHVISNFTLLRNMLLGGLTVYIVDSGKAYQSSPSWWVRDWGSLHRRVLVPAVT